VEAGERVNLFDRFAEAAGRHVARAWFFGVCASFVLLWLIGLPFFGWRNDLYHLLLNSPTTAITFLLVALLQNTQEQDMSELKELERSIDAKLTLLLQDHDAG
jgi:low affinity Fe/Cu permease